MTAFFGLKLIEPLQRVLADAGYADMTPVQEGSLPGMLSARDVVAPARTGRE